MSPGRIIQTVGSISNEASGPSYSVVRLCAELHVAGREVSLATLDSALMPSPPPFARFFELGFGPRRIGRSPAMRTWLLDQAKHGEVQLLHSHGLWMMPNVYPSLAARRYDLPLVVAPRGSLSPWAMKHGSMAKRIFWPLFQAPALLAATCFHATAVSEYDDIRTAGFRQPVAIVPNGIDVPEPIEPSRSKTRTLLFLGRIHPKKGVDILLRAWAVLQAQYSDWVLRIVGPVEHEYGQQMRGLARALGLRRVFFVGARFGAEKTKEYVGADLFVLPTHSENFGNTVAESLAAATPAVVTKGAPWEGLKEKDCGWWIDGGVKGLVDCLRDAMGRTRSELDDMGGRGRVWMMAEFSWERVGRMMGEVYDWLQFGGAPPHCVMED